MDWTADYRMYGHQRINCERIFARIQKEVCTLNNSRPLVMAMDDSLLRKTGKKIPGVKYARDPMGPPFHTNFIRGQRVIQMSAAVSEGGMVRMIPVTFRDASTPSKPRRNATEEEWASYKEDRKARQLSVCGSRCINEVRSQLEEDRDLWVTVDGSYTNRTVLNDLPNGTTIMGRIRSDAKLYHLPTEPIEKRRVLPK